MSNFEEVLKAHEENRNERYPFYLTEAQYNIIKQLVRIQLAELIDADANNRIIDHFTQMDVSLTTQHKNNTITNEDGDLPF